MSHNSTAEKIAEEIKQSTDVAEICVNHHLRPHVANRSNAEKMLRLLRGNTADESYDPGEWDALLGLTEMLLFYTNDNGELTREIMLGSPLSDGWTEQTSRAIREVRQVREEPETYQEWKQ